MPIESESFKNAIVEAFSLAKWYAQEHVLLCLVPAFFIAGVITVFVSQNSVIKYLGARAERWVAYLVASVSGTILSRLFLYCAPFIFRAYTKEELV